MCGLNERSTLDSMTFHNVELSAAYHPQPQTHPLLEPGEIGLPPLFLYFFLSKIDERNYFPERFPFDTRPPCVCRAFSPNTLRHIFSVYFFQLFQRGNLTYSPLQRFNNSFYGPAHRFKAVTFRLDDFNRHTFRQ